MTSVLESINEQRIAFQELSLLYSHIKAEYKNNPPIELLSMLAELSRLYRQKYASDLNKSIEHLELESFCAKNYLSSTRKATNPNITSKK